MKRRTLYRSFSLSLALSLALLLLGAAPRPALAQSPAAHHFRAGTSYYAQGRYKDALREFEESYRLSKKPELLYNIGQTYERMGKMAQAIARYERYLKESGAKNPTLREKIKNLQRRLESTGIVVTCKLAGAEVRVDGKKVGTTPLSGPVAVSAGSHNVQVSKAGYRSFSAFVSVTVGSLIPVKATLQQDASAGGSSAGGADNTAGGASTSGARAGAAAGGDAAAGGATGANDSRGGRTWTWILAATAGALLATAAITGGVALSKAGSAQTDDDGDADTARSLALTSDITLGVGIAAAVGAVVMFFIEGKNAGGERKVSAAPMLGPNLAGASATIRF